MNVTKKTFQYGEHQVTIETGGIARQADGAVMVSIAETVVLVTAVGRKTADPGRDFFPLTVNYQEKTYAAGKIPGGFFKREGRPGEKEVLTCRLIDRPCRPLFPKGFKNEVQIIATVVSLNPDVDPDIPALLGASAALAISGMPFAGPIAAARVGYKDGAYILNPGVLVVAESDLELIVAGTSEAVLMVESEANVLPEDVMLGAVMFGHEQMQVAINAIKELAAEVGKPAWDWQAPAVDEELDAAEPARRPPLLERSARGPLAVRVEARCGGTEADAGADGGTAHAALGIERAERARRDLAQLNHLHIRPRGERACLPRQRRARLGEEPVRPRRVKHVAAAALARGRQRGEQSGPAVRRAERAAQIHHVAAERRGPAERRAQRVV